MTFRELLNTALSEIGFVTYAQYFGSTQQEARQLIALGNRELNQLKKDDWQILRKPYIITMSASKTYPLPSDWRQFNPDTVWSETRRGDFPVTSEVWAYYQARNITNGLRHRVRLADNQIEIDNPQPGMEMYMEYISDSPVQDNAQNLKQTFTSDDDTLILNDDLFILGVIWRFMKVKGLDWQSNYVEYNTMYKRERATDGGAQTIQTVSSNYRDFGGMDAPPYPPHTDLWSSDG